MQRLLTVSVLCLLVFLTSATGQQPNPVQKPAEKKADKRDTQNKQDKQPDATDAAIASALANDGEVKTAKAKVQLAEAELAKAKQAATLKVVMLKTKIEKLKIEAGGHKEHFDIIAKAVARGNASQAELFPVRDKYDSAKAELAIAEAEWKLLVGEDTGENTNRLNALRDHQEMLDLLKKQQVAEALTAIAQQRAAIKGPIPDRLRAALDKPVKLGKNGEQFNLEQAFEEFKKQTGLDVPLRGGKGITQIISISSRGEELPLGAWLQLFQDEGQGTFYVREYGLLIADKKSAPSDALTLTEFWKQKPPAAESKAEPKK